MRFPRVRQSSVLNHFGFDRRFVSDMRFMWRPYNSLIPTIGNDIALSRASSSTGIFNRHICPAPNNDQLTIDHGNYPGYTVYPGYRTAPWSWNTALNVTITHDGPAGALNASMAKIIGSAPGSAVYHTARSGLSATSGEAVTLVFLVARYNASSRYCLLGFGSPSNASARLITFDFDNPTTPAAYQNLVAGDVKITSLANDVYKVVIRTTAYITGVTNLQIGTADPTGTLQYDAATYADQGVYADVGYAFYQTSVEFPLAYPTPEDANAYAAAASQMNVDLGEVVSGTVLALSVVRWNHARANMAADEYVSVLGISSGTAPRMAVFRESSADRLSAWHVDAAALLYSVDLTDSSIMSDIDDGEYVAVCAQYGTDGLRLSALTSSKHYASAIDSSGDASVSSSYSCDTLKLGHYHNAALSGNCILPFAALLNPAGDYSESEIRQLLEQALMQAGEAYDD